MVEIVNFVSQQKGKCHSILLSDQQLQSDRQFNKTSEFHGMNTLVPLFAVKCVFLVKSNTVWNSMMVTKALILYINMLILKY